MEGTKKIKSTSFHPYSWNSEVETTWISSVGWHHKTSTMYCANKRVDGHWFCWLFWWKTEIENTYCNLATFLNSLVKNIILFSELVCPIGQFFPFLWIRSSEFSFQHCWMLDHYIEIDEFQFRLRQGKYFK